MITNIFASGTRHTTYFYKKNWILSHLCCFSSGWKYHRLTFCSFHLSYVVFISHKNADLSSLHSEFHTSCALLNIPHSWFLLAHFFVLSCTILNTTSCSSFEQSQCKTLSVLSVVPHRILWHVALEVLQWIIFDLQVASIASLPKKWSLMFPSIPIYQLSHSPVSLDTHLC